MNRDELIDLLARLVDDGELTEAEAVEILRQFDAGEVIFDLPLPANEAIRQTHDQGNERLALLALFALLGGYGMELRPMPPQTGIRLANALQDGFERRATTMARLLASGTMTRRGWQAGMLDEIERNIMAQMYLANGEQMFTRAQLDRLDRLVMEQSAYLQRFADQASLRQAQGGLWSVEYIANRAAMYGGVGRGEYFRSDGETRRRRGEIGEDVRVHYISMDDRSTCVPCLEAERNGPYRIDAPYPVPGEICLGGGNCRCYLEYR